MNQNLEQTIKLQQIASDPQNSVWVFASAGSGKTKILTDRVLRLLLEGNRADKILCLTFTKNAAAEMEERINKELAKWVLCDEEELHKKLESLTGAPPAPNQLKTARILFNKILDDEFKIKAQTIHSFCQAIIQIFPFESKVKPGFAIAESNQEALFLKQAQKQLLQNALQNPDLANLVKEINSRLDEESFLEIVANFLSKKEKLLELKERFFGIENLIAEIYKKFNVEISADAQKIFDKFIKKIDLEEIRQLVFELENSDLKTNQKMAFEIRDFFENPNLKNFASYQETLFTKENEPRKLSKNTALNVLINDLFPKQQNLAADFLEQFNSLKICENTALILRFVEKILEIYSNIKKQNSLLDYNDLILKTNQLLANPEFSNWVKMKMDGTFNHILVDESQDTNHHQWNIIKALCEDFFSGLSAVNQNRSIFIVGDEKQSIYSFQGAEPHISEEIFSYFSNKLGNKLKRISLNNSFRSTATVLEAVDRIFLDEKIKNSVSKISQFQSHKAIRQSLGVVEIWPQIKKEKTTKKEISPEWNLNFSPQENYDEKDQMAELIASKIKDWVENKRILASANRPVKYGDFMILLRKRVGDFNSSLNKFFHQYQIPFSTAKKINFSDNLLLQDLLATAKFATLQEDDLNLAALLKSPFLSLSEDDLFEICLVKNQKESSIYQALGEIEKFSEIKNYLDELILKSQKLDVFEFYYFLLEENNNRQKIIAYFGLEALEILDQFLLLTKHFCNNFSNNLQKFLEFIEKIDPEISVNNSEENLVKINTIHGAKGLQAPIVIIPDCCYNFNQLMVTKEKIFFLDELPIFLAKKSDENKLIKQHKALKLQEAQDEYLRLFYVALTRAEDELYLGGFGNSSDTNSWYEIACKALPNLVQPEEILEIKKDTHKKTGESFTTKSSPVFLAKTKNNFIKNKIIEDQLNSAQLRGKITHKILEIFGKNYKQNKDWLLNLAKKIIAKEEFLSQKEQNIILEESTNFLNSKLFAEIFCDEIKCEVEIADGKNIFRIDLLKVSQDEVLIVDYKTDENLPDIVPQQYQEQLNIYKNSIAKIYSDKKVSTAILWVKFCKLQKI